MHQKNTEADRKQKAADSIGLYQFLVRTIFLSLLAHVLTAMKKEPSKPPKTPKITPAKSNSRIFAPSLDMVPNLRADPVNLFKKSTSLIWGWMIFILMASQTARVKVQIAHEKNTFQIIANFQNVFGWDNS